MLRINFFKFITICLLIAVLADFTDAETVKQNPFEVMRAIVEQEKQLSKSTVQIDPAVVKDMPELFLEAVMLNFLQAKNILPAIENLVQPYGSISTDDETNTLIISGTREQVDKVLKQVRKADQMPKQIMIEVVILDIRLDDDTEIGVDWSQTMFGRDDSKQTYSHTLFPSSVTTGMNYGFIQDGINVTVKALQEKKDVEIIASPRVMVVSGQTAHIETTEQIPYEEASDSSSGGSDSLTSTKFKDVGLVFDVTAKITDEGKIFMTVKPSQSVKTGESINDVPVVDNRAVSTTLIMEDGQVVVIGGLRKKQETLTSHNVPWLCDLPIVGGLFRSDKTEVVSSELLIMLSPHIYNGKPPITDYELKRFNELKDQPPLQFQSKQPRVLENIHTAEAAIKKITGK